jgi:hypothetical protein
MGTPGPMQQSSANVRGVYSSLLFRYDVRILVPNFLVNSTSREFELDVLPLNVRSNDQVNKILQDHIIPMIVRC